MKKLFTILTTATMIFTMSVSTLAQSIYTVTVNSEKVSDNAYQESNTDKGILVPVRAVGEALGFKVVWNPEDKTIFLDDNSMHATLTINEDNYIASTSIDDMVGTTAPFSLGQAPKIINGSAYVPVGIFVPLLGNDDSILSVEDNNVVINTNVLDNTEIPNPITEHKTIEELNNVVGFDVKLPKVGNDYKITFMSNISDDLAQVVYNNGSNEITYRMAKGNDDISGDYNVYNDTKTVEIKGAKVTLKGNDGKYNVAVWSKGDYTYSLGSYNESMTENGICAVVESVEF